MCPVAVRLRSWYLGLQVIRELKLMVRAMPKLLTKFQSRRLIFQSMFNQLEVKRKSADAGIDHPPNATGEPRPTAGATKERRLLGVGSTGLLGSFGGQRFTFPNPTWLAHPFEGARRSRSDEGVSGGCLTQGHLRNSFGSPRQ